MGADFTLSGEDRDMLRAYVTAKDHEQYDLLPQDVVSVHVTHCNLPQKLLDLRFDKHSTIDFVKQKLRTHIGTPVEHQRLWLRQDGRNICEMMDNSKMLGYYSVESGMEIHIIDTDPFSLSRGGGLTDTSLVEKYKMSDEAYDARKGTLREFIRNKKKENPNWKPSKTAGGLLGTGAPTGQEGTDPPPGPESVVGIEVGMRCQVAPGSRRGEVKFVGEVPEMKAGGFWVGVVFDEPVGLGDGTAKGVKYFDAETSHGSFIRGKNVTVGDFPERDLMDSDVEDEDGVGDDNKENENDEDEI